MALSQFEIQNAKPALKPYKMFDGDGLYLLIHPKGGKYWRFKYQFARTERTLALGTYPEISLADARDHRHEYRKLVANQIDPADVKRQRQQQLLAAHSNTFESLAIEWLDVKRSKLSAYYAKQIMQRFEKDIFPKIGNRPIQKITAPDLLAVAKKIEERNAIEIAHRAIQICGQVFQHAIITGRCDQNPALALRGALKTPLKSNYAYLKADQLPEFLRKLDDHDGCHLQTKLGIKLLMLTFVRTSELCGAKWSEIDFEKKEWRIPAERMKMRTIHIVPLSTQALEILTILRKMNNHREHVFPGVQAPKKCMSNNTMLQAIYGMGYKSQTTGHGFRATASTILYESELFERDVIERQLAHQERNKSVAAYNHSEYLPKRRIMMQWWADYLANAITS